MNGNVLQLVLPALKTKTEQGNDSGDMGLILPLVLLFAVDTGDAALIMSLLYMLM